MRLGRVRLAGTMGQEADYSSSVRDAARLVRGYDALLSRLALAADDSARGETMIWLGRADLPGSPAERYAVVVDALVTGAEPDETFAKRVSDLGSVVEELGARVESAESSGTLPAPGMGAGSTTEEGTPEGKCLAGGVALLGLFVLPFIVH